jgi:kinesin family member 18A
VMDMIVRGNEFRTMSPTEANATSSRSHAVLQINIAQKDRNADVNEPHTMATLSIIDLAGSERASVTKNRGDRLLEGANINKSLLALGSCINALCDPRKRNHVPYRNSKLTRLLKFSLGGNCRTVMIVCVSPSSVHFDETQNTLRYANRAKNIQTKVTRNVYNVNRHVKDFLKKIDEQMALINELKQQQKDHETASFAKFRKQMDKKDNIVREGVARIRTAYENSLAERHERTNMMKKLRQIERRISLISAWVAGFDTVCETRDEEDPPANLVTMKKTAQGILAELENSRHHYHQRMSKNNWDRALESALQTGIRQIKEADAGNNVSEVDSLIREAEVLRNIADREMYTTLLEQEKGGDAALIQVLLQAHFDTVAILHQVLQMTEAEAVQTAKRLLGQIVASCTTASSQVIKPDGGLPVMEAFPPTKAGTPKHRKLINVMGPSPIPALAPPDFFDSSLMSSPRSSPLKGSPMKNSPRRRKLGPARKGVSFTPKKKSPSKAKRGVRWKDDTDAGPLAEYQATPKAMLSTPELSSAEAAPPPPPVFSIPTDQSQEGSSPLPPPPQTSMEIKPRLNKFQAGFLSKKSTGSPLGSVPTSSVLGFSSDSDTSPLREIELNKVPIHSPLHVVSNASSDVTPDSGSAASSSDDEAKPTSKAQPAPSFSQSTSAWKPTFDLEETKQIRSALRRKSSVGSTSHHNPNSATVSHSAARAHRRRSPTASSGSPPIERPLFSAGHARRMGSMSQSGISTNSVLSPRVASVIKSSAAGNVARRTTVGGEDGRPASGLRANGPLRPGASAANVGPPGSAVRGSLAPGSKGIWR